MVGHLRLVHALAIVGVGGVEPRALLTHNARLLCAQRIALSAVALQTIVLAHRRCAVVRTRVSRRAKLAARRRHIARIVLQRRGLVARLPLAILALRLRALDARQLILRRLAATAILHIVQHIAALRWFAHIAVRHARRWWSAWIDAALTALGRTRTAARPRCRARRARFARSLRIALDASTLAQFTATHLAHARAALIIVDWAQSLDDVVDPLFGRQWPLGPRHVAGHIRIAVFRVPARHFPIFVAPIGTRSQRLVCAVLIQTRKRFAEHWFRLGLI